MHTSFTYIHTFMHTYIGMAWRRRALFAASSLAWVCAICGGTSPSLQSVKPTLASLGPNFQWNCETAGHKGKCGKLNRSIATFEVHTHPEKGLVGRDLTRLGVLPIMTTPLVQIRTSQSISSCTFSLPHLTLLCPHPHTPAL